MRARCVVIDPGTLSEPESVDGVDAILLTHEHIDHLDVQKLADAVAKRPSVTVFAHPEVRPKLGEFEGAVTEVVPGDEFTAAGFRVRAYGGLHAMVHPEVPRVANVGFFLEGEGGAGGLYHPGDSFDVPTDADVETLFVPVSGPFLKVAEAIEFVRAIKPRRAFAAARWTAQRRRARADHAADVPAVRGRVRPPRARRRGALIDDLAEVVARLYSVPPDEFIAERDAAVAAARRAGRKDLAVRIGKLRKPTIAAWLVNLLSHQRPDLIGELLALGDELRDAQRELRGDALRELSLRRRATISALAREARELAVGAGRPVRDKLPLAEVEQTLTAALADAYIAGEVRAGTLTRPLDYAGFGELPRPRLRLVKGGKDDQDETAEPEPQPAATATKPVTTKPVTTKAVTTKSATTPPAPRPTAEAIQRARAMKAARREMLAASLQMADAQVKRDNALKALAAADKAMAAAQQRADEAKAVLDELTP